MFITMPLITVDLEGYRDITSSINGSNNDIKINNLAKLLSTLLTSLIIIIVIVMVLLIIIIFLIIFNNNNQNDNATPTTNRYK